MSTVRIVVGVIGIAAVAAVTMHHPRVRSVLFGKGGAAGCPQFGAAAEVDGRRNNALAALAGLTAAPQKRLFGLAVGRDTRADVSAWADARGVRCDNVDGEAIRCARTTKLLGVVESDIYLRFASDRLVAVDAVGTVPGGDANAAYRTVEQDVAANYGPAHNQSSVGDVSKAGRVASAWRFAELAIDVSVFAVGDAPRVRVQLRSLKN